MTYKLKEEFKGKTITNMKQPLDSLKQHHIANLSEHIRSIYFEEIKPKKKKNA